MRGGDSRYTVCFYTIESDAFLTNRGPYEQNLKRSTTR
jgi:hypothetical protein